MIFYLKIDSTATSLGTALLSGILVQGHDRVGYFSHVDGKPLDLGVVNHTFPKVLKKTGLPHIRFHDLRHTYATLLLKAGIHPKIVSERLGHANIGITLDTYSHVLPGLQERAVGRFDEMLESRVITRMLAKC